MRTMDVVDRSLAILQATVKKYRMVSFPPDVTVEVPADACGTLDFHRARSSSRSDASGHEPFSTRGTRESKAPLKRQPATASGTKKRAPPRRGRPLPAEPAKS